MLTHDAAGAGEIRHTGILDVTGHFGIDEGVLLVGWIVERDAKDFDQWHAEYTHSVPDGGGFHRD